MSSPLIASTTISASGDSGTSSPINTIGSSLIVIAINNEISTFGVSDSEGNEWTQLTTYDSTLGANDTYQCFFYCANPTTSSSHTFSATGSEIGACVAAFSGTTLSSAFDQQNGAALPSEGTDPSPGSVTPTQNGELIVTATGSYNGPLSEPTITDGFTLTDSLYGSVAGNTCVMAYLVQETAAAINPTWDAPGASYYVSNIATFLPAPTPMIPYRQSRPTRFIRRPRLIRL